MGVAVKSTLPILSNEELSEELHFNQFNVRKEDITRSQVQLSMIVSMTELDRQFVATLIDTEAARGYFLNTHNRDGDAIWTAYVSVKMKFRGLVCHLSELAGLVPPTTPTTSFNTLTKSKDQRWSKQLTGIVAWAMVLVSAPFLYNEKSIVEARCILKHGPSVRPATRHPFAVCGGVWVRRGVWNWRSVV